MRLYTVMLLLSGVHASRPPPSPRSIQTAKLKFTLSGRNLVDKDGFTSTDGYCEVYYSNDGGRSMRKLGHTEIVLNKRNPDWTTVFEFHFDRKLKQYWYFHVFDWDHLTLDQTVGRVWVNVADFVDKSQVAHSNLDYGGYLTIKSANHASQRKDGKSGILPFRRGTPVSKKIKFTVTSNGLSKNANHHEVLTVAVADGVNGGEKIIGKSTAITSSTNPGWTHVFSLNWNKLKDHRLHFKIYDGVEETLHNKIGDAWIEANDYIAKGETFTVLLPTKGRLTMTKVASQVKKHTKASELENITQV